MPCTKSAKSIFTFCASSGSCGAAGGQFVVTVEGELGRVGGCASGVEGRNMDHFCLRADPFDAAAIGEHLGICSLDMGELIPGYGAEGHGPSLYITDPKSNRVERKGPPTL